MKVNSVAMNNCGGFKNPNFKAKFVDNEISRELIRSSSAEDVAEFKLACSELANAQRDSRAFMLTGVTSGYGICSESEVGDRFIDLNYRLHDYESPSFLRTWFIKTEDIISGGYEKKNILKEVTNALKNIVKENAFVPKYKPSEIIVKKASYVSKLI